MTDPLATIKEWVSASEAGDASRASSCLAPDAVLISPLTGQFRFRGQDAVNEVLTAAFQVIHDIHFHTTVGEGSTWALFYNGRCGNQALEEAQLLRLDSAQRVVEITLFGRPLPALTAVMSHIGPLLLRQQQKAGLATAIRAMTAPLHAVTSAAERWVVPLADPHR